MSNAEPQAAHRIARASALVVWRDHHRAALLDTLRTLRASLGATVLVGLTLGVALALPALLWIATATAATVSADWAPEVRVNVFVEEPNERSLDALLERMKALSEVATLRWQSPETSLAEFLDASGFESAAAAGIEALGGSPLPGVAILTPTAEARAPARIGAFAARLEALPGVVGVQVDQQWVERFAAGVAAAQRLGLGLGVLLGIGTLLAVAGLTVARIQARRAELGVLRLVGATEAFVRRPFLYEGALHGVLGGVLAVLIVAVLRSLVAGPLGDLLSSYGLLEATAAPGLGWVLALPCVGAALGWTGARLALASRLGREDLGAP